MTDSAIIAVVQAHAEGKKIQCNYKNRANIDWWDVGRPNWDFSEYDFRVAPEPRKPREFWLCDYTNDSPAYSVYNYPAPKLSAREVIHVREVIE